MTHVLSPICERMIWFAVPVSGLVENGGSHFSCVPQPSSLGEIDSSHMPSMLQARSMISPPRPTCVDNSRGEAQRRDAFAHEAQPLVHPGTQLLVAVRKVDRCEAGAFLDQPTPVGSYTPNAWGACDMHGNLHEWCQDWYGPLLPGGSVVDLEGPATGLDRLYRGGSYLDPGQFCRSAVRRGARPETYYCNLGFRVALAQVEDVPVEAVLTVTPASQDFGVVLIGAAADRSFIVSNAGGGTLDGTAEAVAPFSVVSGGSYSLAAGLSQVVTVRVGPQAPNYIVSDLRLAFRPPAQGQFYDAFVTVANAGGQAGAAGNLAVWYTPTSPRCGQGALNLDAGALAPGESRVLLFPNLPYDNLASGRCLALVNSQGDLSEWGNAEGTLCPRAADNYRNLKLSSAAVRPTVVGGERSVTLPVGAPLLLSADVTGNPPPFVQWRKNKTNVVESEQVVGARFPVLYIPKVAPQDAGGYTVVASNFLGMVTGVVATVSISQGPVGSLPSDADGR